MNERRRSIFVGEGDVAKAAKALGV